MPDHHVALPDGATLFVRETGIGPTVVFVPAWSMSSEAFSFQIQRLSAHYRVLAIDPRSQGRSSTTCEGNDYRTHAHDLRQVIEHFKVDRFSLVGWSNGALAAAYYVDFYGPSALDAFINIDMPPLALPQTEGDWSEVASFNDFSGFLTPLTMKPTAFQEALVPFFVHRALSPVESTWLIDQMRSQAPFVGRLLMSDILFYDFSKTLIELSQSVPVFIAARSQWAQAARDWVQNHCPAATFGAFDGGHMFFWEDPEPFNAQLSTFLTSAIEAPAAQ